MFHAVVMIFVLGLNGPNHHKDLQFLDEPPSAAPAACWLKFDVTHGGNIVYGICVDKDQHEVYAGRLAEMIDT